MRQQVTLARDCEAAEIPYGNKTMLPVGSLVTITQSLGGSYTVVTDHGYMVRIAGDDADALGEEFVTAAKSATTDTGEKPLLDQAWEQLRTCYDPEIPVNIVDLGLVYSCELAPLPDGQQKVSVRFTLTAPGCGMGDYLREDVKSKLLRLPGVKEADVQVVLDPPWDQTRMSDAARLQLGMM